MNIKVVGIGGIGCCLLPSLARWVAWTYPHATLTLIDGDRFEERNRQRQSFTQPGNKAAVIAQQLKNEFPCLDIRAEECFVTSDNVIALLRPGDVVLVCVDNHETRRIISERGEAVEDITIISGANELTSGTVQVFLRRQNRNATLPLANQFTPEIKFATSPIPATMGCEAAAPVQPQLLFMNNLIAARMLGVLYRCHTGAVPGFDLIYCDLLTGHCRAVCRRENVSS